MTPVRLRRSTLIALSLLLEPRPLLVTYKDGSTAAYSYTVTYQGAELHPLLEHQAAVLQ